MYTIKTIPLGYLDTNCYILISGNEAAVIDPAESPDIITKACSLMEAEIKYVILTHGHYDHMGAAESLKEGGAELICHKEEEDVLNNPKKNLSEIFGQKPIFVTPTRTVTDGEHIILGDISLKVLHTPGHTKGSMSLYFDDNLFSGDALFERSIGRTDFPTGSTSTLIKSIKEKLFTLPENTVVYPGHGDSTTIGTEKRENFYVR